MTAAIVRRHPGIRARMRSTPARASSGLLSADAGSGGVLPALGNGVVGASPSPAKRTVSIGSDPDATPTSARLTPAISRPPYTASFPRGGRRPREAAYRDHYVRGPPEQLGDAASRRASERRDGPRD